MSSSIQDVPEELVALLGSLREQRLRLDESIAANPKGAAKLTKSLSELANALRALSAESRQWSNQVAESMKNASPAQKTEVALLWLSGLPVGSRTAAYKQLVDIEEKSFERLPLLYGS